MSNKHWSLSRILIAEVVEGGDPVGAVFPCVLSYCLQHEVETTLMCHDLAGLAFALDRFRGDEERFGVGLMAVLATAEAGTLFIGSSARAGAACLAYATKEATLAAKPSLPRGRSIASTSNSAGAAAFHLFYPDCPAYLSEYETLPWPTVQVIALTFAEGGTWTPDVEWFD